MAISFGPGFEWVNRVQPWLIFNANNYIAQNRANGAPESLVVAKFGMGNMAQFKGDCMNLGLRGSKTILTTGPLGWDWRISHKKRPGDTPADNLGGLFPKKTTRIIFIHPSLIEGFIRLFI